MAEVVADDSGRASSRIADALAQTALLGRLERTALEGLAARGRLVRYRPGEVLVHQGERGDSLLVLVEGAATVYRETRRGRAALSHLRPPAVVGEVTLLDGSPRTATVEAVEPSAAASLARADLLRCAEENPQLLDGLLAALGGLVRRLTERAADAVLLDLGGRVAKTLLVLGGGGGRGPYVVRLSQGRLAELVGSTRQSLNQVLGGFAERGLLHLEGREVVLDDLDGLRRRAGLAVPPPPVRR